jgi:hypothetical protein
LMAIASSAPNSLHKNQSFSWSTIQLLSKTPCERLIPS